MSFDEVVVGLTNIKFTANVTYVLVNDPTIRTAEIRGVRNAYGTFALIPDFYFGFGKGAYVCGFGND